MLVQERNFMFIIKLNHFFNVFQGYFETARSELTSKGLSITMICPGMVHSDILTACATENHDEVTYRSLNKSAIIQKFVLIVSAYL